MSLASLPPYEEDPREFAAPDRTPPQDVQAEQSVLGAMLLSKDAIGDVAEVVRGRDFYLDPADVRFLVDSAGNAGPTAWVDGRVMGTWTQDEGGAVRLALRRTVGPDDLRRLEAEALRLTQFLDGQVIASVYAARLRKGLALR